MMESLEPSLRIYICGRLAIERFSVVLREADFPARQGRRLWAYLVLNRMQPVGREDLAAAVWEDAIPDAWDVSLNALISRLRRILRPLACSGLLPRGEPGRYALELPAGTFIDYERARAGLHRAEVELRQTDYGTALAEARVATEIAARGFLPGESGAWVEGQRRLLADTRLHAVEVTVMAELARGHPVTAEREAEQLVTLDPLREASYRLLMRARAATGNPQAVRRVLVECRQVFAAYGGMTPSDETERLARDLAEA